MFIVLLRFSANKSRAGEFMPGHKAWIQSGFDDGVFLLVGSVKPSAGGAILAHRTTLPELQKRVSEDPFVAEQVVTAEVLEIEPSRVDDGLDAVLMERSH